MESGKEGSIAFAMEHVAQCWLLADSEVGKETSSIFTDPMVSRLTSQGFAFLPACYLATIFHE